MFYEAECEKYVVQVQVLSSFHSQNTNIPVFSRDSDLTTSVVRPYVRMYIRMSSNLKTIT